LGPVHDRGVRAHEVIGLPVEREVVAGDANERIAAGLERRAQQHARDRQEEDRQAHGHAGLMLTEPRRFRLSYAAVSMGDFQFQDILPLGPDETPYRKLTSDYVSTFEAAGKTFLKVEPEALTLLTRQAMRDISHLLRPGHLGQLRAILDDGEASPNDKFVAL